MNLKSFIMDAITIVALAALVLGGAYIWRLNKELGTAKEQVAFAVKERNAFESANKTLETTVSGLRQDLKAAEDARGEKVVTETKIKEVVKERLVYVDRIVQADPVLNKRELSPVLKDTIARIQQARKEQQ